MTDPCEGMSKDKLFSTELIGPFLISMERESIGFSYCSIGNYYCTGTEKQKGAKLEII